MRLRTKGRLRGVMSAAIGIVSETAGALTAGNDTFKARLSPVPLDPQAWSRNTGDGAVTAVLDKARLTISGTFCGLQSIATVARLHEGGSTGVRGPAIADLGAPHAASGKLDSQVTLSATQQQSLREGRLYVQIHSESAPTGHVWGWLLPDRADAIIATSRS